MAESGLDPIGDRAPGWRSSPDRGNNSRMESHSRRKGPSFSARGGCWVVAQAAVFAIGAVLPVSTARAPLADWCQPGRGSGVSLFALGLALSGWAAAALGRALTPYPRPRDDGEFCTRGPYRLARHPIYTGVWLVLLGWALVWQSAAGVGFVALAAVFFDLKARREERWLVKKYPSYADYRQRVRKFFPGIY